jgi:protein TonB
MTPPEPVAVIAVELVRGSDVAARPGEPASGRSRPPQAIETAAAGAARIAFKAEVAAGDTGGETNSLDRPDRPLAAEKIPRPTGPAEATLPIPPIPRRKPVAVESSTGSKVAKTETQVEIERLKGPSPRSTAPSSAREAAHSDADRATARKQRAAKLDVRKDHAVAALPAAAAGGGPDEGVDDGPRAAPRYGGADLSNPRPRYPYLARRRGQEGRVLLRVEVTAAGDAAAVSLRQSSGYRLLDDAAVEAVRKWRFAPASRGGHPVAGSVDVPVSFKLTD